ncbi:hypothetical protein LTR56_009501 [Elasticomyces elasticus]|nr:hypothetical protein LTR22_021483 [Elasticomyces elasticus]KAK3644836.1 hypothetical protein LTR56_009501 [Elasticomyces elasticus]KAK4930980.1 hypothetical protein LTR49_002395 [Elasticomyces elasticus]KAK5742541.1 hypothetical protein LTS12_024214 [Elasticomyces elasticus]
MADDAGPSLLTLPVELREMIYDLVFAGVVVNLNSTKRLVRICQPLLRTSKQIRDEALPRYHKSVTFNTTQWKDLVRFLLPMPTRLRLALSSVEYVVYTITETQARREEAYWYPVLSKGLRLRGIALRDGVLKVQAECFTRRTGGKTF